MAYDPDLLDQLERLEAQPWSGTVFRYTGGRRPEQENTVGARWNPPEIAAIYTALDRDTLLAEFEYHFAAHSPRPRRSAFTLYSMRVEVQNVVDLRGPGLLEKLGISSASLGADDHSACRRVGGAIEYLPRGGILVPSARRSAGDNLVIFPHHQNLDYEIEVRSHEPMPTGRG